MPLAEVPTEHDVAMPPDVTHGSVNLRAAAVDGIVVAGCNEIQRQTPAFAFSCSQTALASFVRGMNAATTSPLRQQPSRLV